MTRTRCSGVLAALGPVPLLLVLGQPARADADRNAPGSEEGPRFFREKIEPVLAAACYRCHSAKAEKLRGGLRLDTPAGLLEGGDSGPAVVPGNSGESLLIQAIRHSEGLAMPPQKPRLPDPVIADFVQWVDRGAPMPAAGATAEVSPYPAEARRHWAFQPVRKPRPPTVSDPGWVANPVDAFILARLEASGLKPAAPADPRTLIRRLTFDLTGLPPAPEESDAFVAAARRDPEGALEQAVDRLLASPHYGERWAQHWLDVVRYAETEGFEYDRHIPDAWRYRDYVIGSLNRDKPFDRFVIEQLAGDEIGPDDAECQTAAIFHRLGPVRRNAGNPEIALSRNEVLTERTDIIGSAFLGLTIGCARCHNHKLEPITQKDYYRLQAYLAATDEHDISLAPPEATRVWEETSRKLKSEIQRIQRRARLTTGPEREHLMAQIAQLEDQLPPPLAMIPSTWNDPAKRTPIHVLRRGVWENKGDLVGPRPPGVLVPDELPELSPDDPAPRTRLARWLADPNHPLTARVLVNRIWQHHFGTGLVKTANDFGTKGDPPSHPELLDWLTATFVEQGWRLKPIHRLIVLSSSYRQASEAVRRPEAVRCDPENRLLSSFPRRRLTAEELRDAMLAVSGRLQRKAGGPSVMVPVDAELVRLLYKPTQWQLARDPKENDRRSIYLIAKRNLRLPFAEVFDAPALSTSCPRRESSTHAPQALELLNGTLANDLAGAFADRLAAETDGTAEQVVDRAFRLALGRPPTVAEHELAVRFVREQPLREFALAVFNLNGFLYVR